jgi:hypothetical protein
MRRLRAFLGVVAVCTLAALAAGGDLADRPQIMQTADATTLVNPYRLVAAPAGAGLEFIGLSSSAGTTSMDYPAGTQPGDLVVVMGGADYYTNSLTIPTGFSSGETGYSYLINYMWAYRIAPNPVPSQIEGLQPDSNGYDAAHLALTFRGVNQTTPFAEVTYFQGASVTNPDPPAITQGGVGTVHLALGWLDDDEVASSVGAPDTMTLAGAVQGQYITVMAAYKIDPAVDFNADKFSSTGQDGNLALSLVLQP